jgi:hypothetical protein
MNSEGSKEEMTVYYFEVLSHHLRGETEENFEKPPSVVQSVKKSTDYEDPRYAIFHSLLFLPLSYMQMQSSTPCSQTFIHKST